MIPRTEVEFLSGDMTVGEAVREVIDRAHSRYPVTGATVDEILGVVHLRDLLTALLTDRDAARQQVRRFVRPVPLLPTGKPMLDALAELRARRAHLAVVVDEYGGTAGIVTLEDILEELVGEIEDEYDLDTPSEADGAALDGLLHRDEVAERAGINLPPGPYETLAGYVQTALGRVPAVGDAVDVGGHRLTVTEMDNMRVARVQVDPEEQADATGDADRPRGR
jgi:putative hemolysin